MRDEPEKSPLSPVLELLETGRLHRSYRPRMVTGVIVAAGDDVALLRSDSATGEPSRDLVLPITEWFPGRRWATGMRLPVWQLNDEPRALVSVVRTDMIEAVLAGVSPEVRSGIVRVMGVVRQPGVRSKVAVATTVDDVDPIAACVGRAACRVRTAGTILGGERLDVVAWHPNPEQFLRYAMAPASVTRVETDGVRAVAFVPPHQMSAAVGGSGLNSQLAGRLTGFQVTVAPDHHRPSSAV